MKWHLLRPNGHRSSSNRARPIGRGVRPFAPTSPEELERFDEPSPTGPEYSPAVPREEPLDAGDIADPRCDGSIWLVGVGLPLPDRVEVLGCHVGGGDKGACCCAALSHSRSRTSEYAACRCRQSVLITSQRATQSLLSTCQRVTQHSLVRLILSLVFLCRRSR